MAANEPIDPRVRLAIADWPDDAPRGAVTTFCAEHGISRKSFYALRKRAEVEGPAAVLEPKSRRPASSPLRLTDEVKQQAIDVRGYADFMPLGASVVPMRSTDSIMWTVKFRDGSLKRFKFPIRTTAEGEAAPEGGYETHGDLNAPELATEPASNNGPIAKL